MNKNLKKVISAVAALALSASAVSAFAVNFPDVEETASYAQAVEELSALDIISGYDDGTFRPDELVTRAQISKMVVDALNERAQAESSRSDTKFVDVSTDHWAKGYINQGVADGFISGYSDTEFGPDDNVTYVQAQSMLVRAIGYETYAQAAGGWPSGYKQYAASTGITSGISGIADDTQLTRAQVAQMLDNAMDAPICVITGWTLQWNNTRTPDLEVKDGEGKDYQTLFSYCHNAYKVYGRVTDTNKTDASIDTDMVKFRVEKADNFDDEYIKTNSGDEVEEDMYFGTTDAPNMLRTYAQALIHIDDNDDYTILSIVAAASTKSVTLAAEDIDEDKSDANENKLYFYPAGTSKNSVKYAIDANFTAYVNGIENDGISGDYEALVDYIVANETSSVTLQKETKIGSTSTETDYNLIMISTYRTAVVEEVVTKSDSIAINLDSYAAGLGSKITVYTDDDSYTYSFELDGVEIEPTDLQENDVLSIAYDETGRFSESSFYDVLVSRDTVSGKCTAISSSEPKEYTIGGVKYKIADDNLVGEGEIETSGSYTVYLDHFGRIAMIEEDSSSKKLAILKNIYKKTGGDWYAQIITTDGQDIEYKIDSSNANAYSAYLGLEEAVTEGVDYADGEKIEKYPNQVISYSVSGSNKLTIKDKETIAATADNAEYKESSSRFGTVRLGDSTVILDISDIDTKDEVKVVSQSNLVDGNDYSGYGYYKTTTGTSYQRFVIITEGVSGFNSETQLAVFDSSESVEVDGEDMTAFNVFVQGEKQLLVVDDDVVTYDELNIDDLEEGDPILFTTNASGYISKIQPVFADLGFIAGATYEDFYTYAILNDLEAGVLLHPSLSFGVANSYWNDLLDGTSDDMDIVFGAVVNKSGNNITLVQGTEADYAYIDADDVLAGLDTGLELSTKGAIVYTYDFSASKKNSRIFNDYGLAATSTIKAAKRTDVAGNEWLNIADDEVEDEVVFAVARIDNDEVKEIYLFVNGD